MTGTPNEAGTLGAYVGERRRFLGLTQAEAAQRAGMNRRAWQEIEAGNRVGPEERLQRIEEVLDLSPGILRAMQPTNESRELERLRARAVAMLRVMSTSELETFIGEYGDSWQRQLRQEVAALRREVEGLRHERMVDRAEGGGGVAT
jgi:transcriptional regulator with XRE-family HTH domain